MKSTKTATILVFIAMFFVGCSKNMDYADPLQESLTSGNFTVSSFFDGQDKTADYTSYVFNFENGGKMVCTTSAGNFSGNWSLVKKVDGPAINISMSVPPTELQNISRQWDVVTTNNSTIELKQASAALRFSK